MSPGEILQTPAGTRSTPSEEVHAPGWRLQMHGGSKRKRARAAADAAKARLAPPARRAARGTRRSTVGSCTAASAEAMHESRAVYAVLVARRCERTGAVVSETWGSEPWVAGELGGTTGVLEIVFRGTPRGTRRAPVLGLGISSSDGVAPRVRRRVVRPGKNARAQFSTLAAFRALGAECASNAAFAEGALERMGVAAVGTGSNSWRRRVAPRRRRERRRKRRRRNSEAGVVSVKKEKRFSVLLEINFRVLASDRVFFPETRPDARPRRPPPVHFRGAAVTMAGRGRAATSPRG